MEESELDKLLASFKGKLKPVTKAEMEEAGLTVPPTPEEVEAAGPPPFEEKPAEVVPAGVACVTKEFRGLVDTLPAPYIGTDGADIKDLVLKFLDSLGVCA